jgi:hypothetical protein
MKWSHPGRITPLGGTGDSSFLLFSMALETFCQRVGSVLDCSRFAVGFSLAFSLGLGALDSTSAILGCLVA